LSICQTVRQTRDDKCCFNAIKTNDLIQPHSFQFSFSLHFKSKIKKKRSSGRKIIYNYTHMI